MLLAALFVAGQDEVYLSEEEGLALLFGKEARMSRGRFRLQASEQAAIERQVGHPVGPSHEAFVATDSAGKTLGFAMVWEEIGKYRPITFLVGTDAEGKILGVHILVYREPIGSDVRKPWWTRQFVGKGPDDPIRRDKDILKISGATMSCDGVCLGVRKVVAIVAAGLVKKPQTVKIIAADGRKEKPIKRGRLVMGTLSTIEAYGPDPALLERAIDSAFAEMQKLDELLSNYIAESELSKMNRMAADRPFEASETLTDFVALSLRVARLTQGAFDPTVEPAVRRWGFFDHQFKVLSAEELAELRPLVNYRNVKLDGRKILFAKKGMALDPGGIGKGYALDRAVGALKKAGVTSAFVDFGHSSMYAIGAPPGEEGWRVGIRDPGEAAGTAVTIRLKDTSLSTSAQYGKIFEEDGKTYGHILDPATCRPVENEGSFSVVSTDAGLADALSTAFVVMGWARARELARQLGVEACSIQPGPKPIVQDTEGLRKLTISDR